VLLDKNTLKFAIIKEGMDNQIELIREKAIYEAMLSSVGDGLIATDSLEKILFINKAAQRMLLLQSNDVIGTDFTTTVPAADENSNLIPSEKRPIKVVIKSGMVFTNHAANFYIRRDGTKFPAAITTSPIVFDSQIIGAIITFRDNTREKEIDAMKSDFLSVAAHQLRTPLGSIRWNLEMIIDNDYGPIEPKLMQTMHDIYTSNSRMITLVNDLLDVARIDELRVQDKPEEISLEEVIQSLLDEKKFDLEKKNIKVNYVSTNDTKFRIMIDPKTFRQSIDNIISNAIKYNINNGGISIFVEYLYPDIKLTFIDSGIGIPKDDLRKITNKFFRASNAVSSETEGSGLGLFVVKSYVEGWGGKIEILSKEGTGTTVIIYIPTQPKVHVLDKHLVFNK